MSSKDKKQGGSSTETFFSKIDIVFQGLAQKHLSVEFDQKQVILLPSFDRKDLPKAKKGRRPHYKRLLYNLKRYAFEQCNKEDIINFDNKHEKITFNISQSVNKERTGYFRETILDQLKTNTHNGEEIDSNKKLDIITNIASHIELYSHLAQKKNEIFGRTLIYTRSGSDTQIETVKKRLTLLDQWSDFNSNSPENNPTFNDFMNYMNFEIEDSTIRSNLIEAIRMIQNATMGLFPGLYEQKKINAAIDLYTGGKFANYAEFNKHRETELIEMQILIPDNKEQLPSKDTTMFFK